MIRSGRSMLGLATLGAAASANSLFTPAAVAERRRAAIERQDRLIAEGKAAAPTRDERENLDAAQAKRKRRLERNRERLLHGKA